MRAATCSSLLTFAVWKRKRVVGLEKVDACSWRDCWRVSRADWEMSERRRVDAPALAKVIAIWVPMAL